MPQQQKISEEGPMATTSPTTTRRRTRRHRAGGATRPTGSARTSGGGSSAQGAHRFSATPAHVYNALWTLGFLKPGLNRNQVLGGITLAMQGQIGESAV